MTLKNVDFDKIEKFEKVLSEHLSTDTATGVHYDREGNVISMARWMALFSSDEYKRVAKDTVCDGVTVSTVWLGVDFSSNSANIFETMVFVEEGNDLTGTETVRYATEGEAVAGHNKILADLKNQLIL